MQKVGTVFCELARAAAAFHWRGYRSLCRLNGITEAKTMPNELGDVRRALGVNAEELDSWGNAVKRTGGTASKVFNNH